MDRTIADYDWDGPLRCTLYVEGGKSPEDLLSAAEGFLAEYACSASRRLAGVLSQDAVYSELFALTVQPNQPRNRRKMKDPEYGPFNYTYYVQTSPFRDASRADYVKVVAQVMTHLHEIGYAVIAVCQFEDELPSYPL